MKLTLTLSVHKPFLKIMRNAKKKIIIISGVGTFGQSDEQPGKSCLCVLFICGLFNDAVSNSDYTPVNGMMIIDER